MHQTLYRKYRPVTFEQVVGQEHITSVLSYEVARERTSHAYLFCGSRGTGKTTCAKILARAVNCLHPVNGSPCGACDACRMAESGTATDIVEMDAASNNGVDYIRDIKDEVAYPPAFLKNRVYIIDEVHMLSQGAFNALLKTLEEPPPHVIFILATTERQKIPATILSRCQRFDFRRISVPVITERLRFIADTEAMEADEDALAFIAKLARGGMRDAISLLELCAGGGERITLSVVRDKVGVGGQEMLVKLFHALLDADYGGIFDTVGALYASSVDLSAFWQEFTSFCRDLIVIKCTDTPERFMEVTGEELRQMKEDAARISRDKLLWMGRLLDQTAVALQKAGDSKRVVAELALIRLCDEKLAEDGSALAARVSALEARLAGGVPVPAEAVRPSVPQAEPPVASEPVPAEPVAPEPIVRETPSANQALTPFGYSAELAEKVAETDDGAASMLRLARLYVRDGKLVIRVSDAFSSMLLNTPAERQLLAGITAGFPGCAGLQETDIVIEQTEKDAAEDALSDIQAD